MQHFLATWFRRWRQDRRTEADLARLDERSRRELAILVQRARDHAAGEDDSPSRIRHQRLELRRPAGLDHGNGLA